MYFVVSIKTNCFKFHKINMKLNYIITCFLLIAQNVSFAHDIESSSLSLNIVNHTGLLEFSLSQYGIEQALLKKYPDLNLKEITPDEFKEVLIKYIQENISCSINGKLLTMGAGIVELGNQIDLKFRVFNIPDKLEYLDVNAPCFQENEKQVNFFTFKYKGLAARSKLNQNNRFLSRFVIYEDQISVDYVVKKSNYSALIGAVVTFFIVIVFFGVKFRR